jgi:hypothetical protein
MRLCILLGALCLAAGCGGSSTKPSTVTLSTLLDTTVTLRSGVKCDIGTEARDFNGTSGKPTTITATGVAGMNLALILYFPDYARQAGSAAGNAQGLAILTMTLTETGAYHINLCDVNGVAGNVRLTVTQEG